MIKSIILLIPCMNWTIFIKLFVRMVLFNSIWFNASRCINNTLFLWYITANSRYFPRFNCLYITPRMFFWNNYKNLWCESTFNKTKNPGARTWVFLMPQRTVTISDVFSFPYKLIRIKWTNLVIKLSVLSPRYIFSNRHFIFRCSMK